MAKNSVKTIMFDFEDTLFEIVDDSHIVINDILDSRPCISRPTIIQIKQACNLTNKYIKRVYGVSLSERNSSSLPEDEWRRINGYLLSQLGLDPSWADDFQGIWEKRQINCKLRKGVIDTLKELYQRNYSLGIISNTSTDLRPYIQREGVGELIETCIQSYEIGLRKPDKEIFEVAANRVGKKAKEIAYVGSCFEKDMEGAFNAGMHPYFIGNTKQCDGFECVKLDKISELLDYFR
ncbi:MAG: HAD family hydrolase [Candidatus Kariarchaeaceae archaeon]